MTKRRPILLNFLILCLRLTQISCHTITLHDGVEKEVEDGVTFTRTIKHLNASFHLSLQEGHCISHDEYGDNNCHYTWGEQVLGNYSVSSPRTIQHGDYMTGSFHVSNECA